MTKPATLPGRPKGPQRADWDSQYQLLKIALRDGKPDAIDNIRRALAKLEDYDATQKAQRGIVAGRIDQKRADIAGLEATVTVLNGNISEGESAMKRLSALLKGQKRVLCDIDEGPTPEMKTKPRQSDYLQDLFEDDKLTARQLDAARQIARLYEATTAAAIARIGRLDGAGGGGGGSFQDIRMAEGLAIARAQFYLPWGLHLREHNPVTLDIVIRIVVFGISIRAVARHNRMRQENAEAKLRDGLDTYWKPCTCHGLAQRKQDHQLGLTGRA